MDETNTVALLNHDGRYAHGKERRWDKCVSCEVVRWLKEPCREYQGRVHSVDIVERASQLTNLLMVPYGESYDSSQISEGGGRLDP